MSRKHINEYLTGIGKAREGLGIPVVTNAKMITNWRTTKNGRSYLILVPKKPDHEEKTYQESKEGD